MSMQRIINYGSFLQAYALKKTIESLGHEVEFVDYHIGNPIVNELNDGDDTSSLLSKAFNVVFSKKYREKRKSEIIQNESYGIYYNKFKSEWLPLLGVTEKKNYNPNIDMLVIGSDEVFNCTQSNPDVGYSPELFGFNSNANTIISYAASFGSTTLQKLTEYHKRNEIASFLLSFEKISVRDKNSYIIVKELTGIEPTMNVDPVLLYDFEKEIPSDVDLKNYIIVYAYSGRINDEEAKAIQEFAHKNNKKTLSIGVRQSFTDEYRCVDPFKMLAYFKNADYVVTDTFHGTVFSIKYQVPFVTLIRDSNSNKLSDLLNKFNLGYRSVSIDDIELVLNQELATSDISACLEKSRTEAIEYLNV